MSETFVVMAGHRAGYGGAWGKGDTLDAAKRQCRKEGGVLGRGYLILTFAEGSEFLGVDDMGYYSWRGERPTKREVPARKS